MRREKRDAHVLFKRFRIGDGNTGIDLMNGPLYWGKQGLRITGGLHDECCPSAVKLRQRPVHKRLRRLSQTSVLARLDYTDDFETRVVSTRKGYSLADGVAAGPLAISWLMTITLGAVSPSCELNSRP